MINEKYLSLERPTVASIYAIIVARIAAANEHRDQEDALPIPGKGAIYAAVKKLDLYDTMKARYGKRIADQKYRPVLLGPRPTRPLERVEIDHTKLDLLVVDPDTRLPLGRCWMTSAIDKRTDAVLGSYTGFTPPSTLSVMNCLRHAIAPKAYVRKRYPSVVNAWETYGIPETIVVDNGPEFHSRAFEDACLQLGITIQYSPIKQPRYKGAVERWFKTQNKQLLHGQPGTTFSDISDCADYDPKKNAVISYGALEEIQHIFIVDVYHQQEHRGIQDVPARLWKAAIAEYSAPRN